MTVAIENSEMSVTVDIDYGARIVSLFDMRTNREWMLQGQHGPEPDEEAQYLGDDAVGWDECFPTVAPCNAWSTPWGGVLRDHGVLWGRRAEIVEIGATHVVTSWRHLGLFVFQRALRLDGTSLRADYWLENCSLEPLPYLWAAHGMLRVTSEDRIVLPTVRGVVATYLVRDGATFSARSMRWPGPNPDWPEPFDHVQPVGLHSAAKLYVSGLPGAAAYVGNESGWLRVGWSREIESLGIWLNYGGWPTAGSLHHIGLEPTSAPVDHLNAAIACAAPAITPGRGVSWSVTYTLRAPAP